MRRRFADCWKRRRRNEVHHLLNVHANRLHIEPIVGFMDQPKVARNCPYCLQSPG